MDSFLDQMNDVWDHQFDDAWNSIHTSDYEAESALTETLDKFFQQYLAVFTALVKEKARGDTLKDRCATALTTSKGLAVESWRIVAKAKLKNAQEESKQLPKRVTGPARALLDEADSALRKGTRHRASLEERTEELKKAINLVAQYLERVRRGDAAS
jgi:aspartate/methionine/tyrosine aminotransferase